MKTQWLLAAALTAASIPEGWAWQAADVARSKPATAVVLRMLNDASGARLAVFRNGKESGSVAVPVMLSPSAVEAGLRTMLLHPNGNDVAAGFTSEQGSFVVVFLLEANGSYLGVDVSRVERVNIGGIGPHRTYKKVETVPTSWLERPENDDAVQIRLRTRVWDLSGQRYSGSEALIITRDGRALWR